MISAQRVLNDWFEISRVSHIHYKVFVPASSADESVQILKVAAALRYDDPLILCHPQGRELWLFGTNNPAPTPAPRWNLVLHTKGTILPSSASLPRSADAPRPWPYLAAIRAKVISHLIQSHSMLPFGNSLYDQESGSLLHVVPGITVQGNLHVRLTSENTLMRPVLSKETPIVWIVPTGRQARLVDTFTAPSHTAAQQFLEVIREFYFISLPPINEGLWVQVSCDGHDFAWPQALVLTEQRAPPNLGWLKYLDNSTRLTDQTAEIAAPKAATPSVSPAAHHYHLMASLPSVYMPPPLPPPPPTPMAVQPGGDPVYPTPQDNSPELHAPELQAPATTEEWPEEWEGDEVMDADFAFFDGPAPAGAIETGEAKKVSEVPQASQSTSQSHDSQLCSTAALVRTPPAPVLPHPSPNPLELSPFKRATGSFAPLDFNSSYNMDQKYLIGGRYFTPGEEDTDAASTQGSPGRQDARIGATENENNDQDDPMNSDGSSSDESMDQNEAVSPNMDDSDGGSSSPVPDPWSFASEHDQPATFREEDRYGDPRTYFSISRQRSTNVSTFTVDNRHQPWHRENWTSFLLSMPKPVTTDYISDECVQALMTQVVWDDGAMSNFGCSARVQSPPSKAVVTSLKTLYPAIRRMSLADICNNTKMNSVASRPASPVIPGAEAVKQESPTTTTQEELHFTLLSPPLYSIQRMDQRHKARAAILRFWRTFGLQPGGGHRDIMVINISLSSRIRADIRERWLVHMKAMYEGCDLGTVTLPTVGPVKNGQMNIDADSDYINPDTLSDLYESECSVLKRVLLEKFSRETRVLVLMSWPDTHRSSPLPLSRGYLALRSGFPNLRWKLVGSEYDSLYPDEIGMVSQYKVMKQALLWYDRWVGRTKPGLEPAFKLARLVPNSINLKYDQQPPTQIFDTDPTMHIAYAVTPDRRWVAVSWSDQWASVTRIKVYRLAEGREGREGAASSVSSPAPEAREARQGGNTSGAGPSSATRLASIFKEIWLDSEAFCRQSPKSLANSNWRIIVIRCGPIDTNEVELWAKTHNSIGWSNISGVYVLSIPRSTSLSVYDGEMLFPHVGMSANDHAMSAPKSPAASDSNQPPKRNDSVIVTGLDETHGIMYETKVFELDNNAPVLAAGVFLKPLNPPSFFGNQQLEVCLVYGVNVNKNSMKQILGHYRRLSSLAENNGVSVDVTILPWHVLAVRKMVRALGVI